ncbi:restriction endonuclease subunit S [Xenorhabdus sp. Flor]|uniref:restriction endonuclease subunit S n=1 Tax=Xenorhabdus cabanillasii TaxID=351673 RepID=UPI0019855643|nr:restriction endonuclease subunit S [Xenorhabdus sp. Flor]MBD2815313.1 restriction endonuclease subunit S [Xenorhabdus sp. Flor]
MSEWCKSRLGEISNISIGGTPSRAEPTYWVSEGEEGTPWVSISDLKRRLVTNTAESITILGARNSNVKLVPAGTIMMSFKLSLGRIAVASRDLYTNEAIASFEIDTDKIDKTFLFYQLPEVVKHAITDTAIKGATLNKAKLNELIIPHPELKTQGRIAEILLTIDNQIDATQALINKYTAIKQGMMADLFSRGIDPETKAFRPTFEEAPELYHETSLGMLPKGWGVTPLGAISEKITSGSRDWAKFYAPEGDLFVRISNLTREHINFRWDSVRYVYIGSGSEGERTQLKLNDILISITADLGIVGVVPESIGRAYINQHTALVRLFPEGENARFIGNFLSSRCGQKQFEKNNDSGAKAGINLPTIASLLCPIPLPEEQAAIASRIDSIDKVIADYKFEKLKSILLKQGLMQDLLTGKVAVPAQTNHKKNMAA